MAYLISSECALLERYCVIVPLASGYLYGIALSHPLFYNATEKNANEKVLIFFKNENSPDFVPSKRQKWEILAFMY